jgi:GAF domain-containing protein
MADVAMRLEAFSPAPRGPVADALETGKVQRMPVTEAALRDWSGSPEHLQVLRALRLNSLVTVPLVDQGEAFGTVTLSSADRDWHASRSAAAAVAAVTSSPACATLARLQRRRRADDRRS